MLACAAGGDHPGRCWRLIAATLFWTLAAKTQKPQASSNVTFLEADAQTYAFRPEYDFCFSRFGTQFFENPVAGLRNMRKGAATRRHHDDDRLARARGKSLAELSKQVVLRICRRPARRRNLRTGAILDGRYRVVTKQLGSPATRTSSSSRSMRKCLSAMTWMMLWDFNWPLDQQARSIAKPESLPKSAMMKSPRL